MTAPTTHFEDTGEWTPLAAETAFLQQVAAETSATLSVAGTSRGGATIHRVDLGAGSVDTMLTVCLQHGNEPISREVALQAIRDLAYSTDPQVTGHLANHRMVWVTNVNPDGLPDTRLLSNGANTNRDFFRLNQLETQAVAGVIADTNPAVIVDAHEYWLPPGAQWLGAANGLPGTHPDIQALGDALYTACQQALTSAGYVAAPYTASIPRAGLSTVAGVHHAVGFLSEVNAEDNTLPQRVDIQRVVYDTAMEWHAANAAALTAARAASIQHAQTTTDPVPLAVGDYIDTAPVEQLDIVGYQLISTAIPTRHLVWGIDVDPTNFVTIQQAARLAIPNLMDTQSYDTVMTATRVERPAPEPAPSGRQWFVRLGGKTREVTQVRFRDAGVTRGVQM